VFWSSRAGGIPGRLLIVAAAALIPAVAGCEAGNDAPVLQWHYPTEGAGTSVNAISIRNVFVLGAPGSQSLPAGQPAGLYFAMVNTGRPDRLVSIQAPGTASAVTIPRGGILVPSNKVVLLSGPEPQAILTTLTRPLTGGSVLTIVLNFQRSGSVSLRVPVIPRSGSYASLSPAPSPSPSPPPNATTSPAGKGKKHHHPAASPSPSKS
jgi:hypothetical protein